MWWLFVHIHGKMSLPSVIELLSNMCVASPSAIFSQYRFIWSIRKIKVYVVVSTDQPYSVFRVIMSMLDDNYCIYGQPSTDQFRIYTALLTPTFVLSSPLLIHFVLQEVLAWPWWWPWSHVAELLATETVQDIKTSLPVLQCDGSEIPNKFHFQRPRVMMVVMLLCRPCFLWELSFWVLNS